MKPTQSKTNYDLFALGGLVNILSTVSSSIISGISYFLIAAVLSAEELGIFGILPVILAFYYVFFGFSFDTLSIRYYSEYKSLKQIESANSLMRKYWFLSLTLVIPFSLFLFLFSDSVSILILGDVKYSLILKLTALETIFFNCIMFFIKTLQALLLIRTSLIFLAILFPARNIIFFFCYLFSGDLNVSILGRLLFDIILVVYLSIIFLQKTKLRNEKIIPKSREIIEFIFPLYLNQTLTFFLNWFDRVILILALGLLIITLEDYALYFIILSIFSLFAKVTENLADIIYPHLAETEFENSIETNYSLENWSKYQNVFFIPFFYFLALFSYHITSIFAIKYINGWIYLAIYFISFSFAFQRNILLSSFIAKGETQLLLLANTIIAVFNFITFFALTLYFGIFGAFLGRYIGYIIEFVIRYFFFRKIHSKGFLNRSFFFFNLWGLVFCYFYFILNLIYLLPVIFFLALISMIKLRILSNEDFILLKKISSQFKKAFFN